MVLSIILLPATPIVFSLLHLRQKPHSSLQQSNQHPFSIWTMSERVRVSIMFFFILFCVLGVIWVMLTHRSK